jgi:hypothetical protein
MEFVTITLKSGEVLTSPAELLGQFLYQNGISQLDIASIVRN